MFQQRKPTAIVAIRRQQLPAPTQPALALPPTGKLTYRLPSAPVAVALPGQNRGIVHTGPVPMPSLTSPLARTTQRIAPVVRPVLAKRCQSCS